MKNIALGLLLSVAPAQALSQIPDSALVCRRNISEIIIHCSATKAGREFHADDIRRWHLQRGFADIGYHFVIALDGTVEPGRPLDMTSAGRPADTRTPAQKRTILTLIHTLRSRYGHLPVCGHRDIPGVAKACPCFDAKAEYSVR